MYWKVISSNFIENFSSAAQAIQFAKSKFKDEVLDEVLIEECGTKACFSLMRFTAERDDSVIIDA